MPRLPLFSVRSQMLFSVFKVSLNTAIYKCQFITLYIFMLFQFIHFSQLIYTSRLHRKPYDPTSPPKPPTHIHHPNIPTNNSSPVIQGKHLYLFTANFPPPIRNTLSLYLLNRIFIIRTGCHYFSNNHVHVLILFLSTE